MIARREARKRDERGITVTEMLVTMAIAAAVSIPLMSMLVSAARHEATQDQQAVSQAELWRATDLISADIRDGTLAPELSTGQMDQSLPILLIQDGKRILVEWEVSEAGLIRHTSEARRGARRESLVLTSDVMVHKGQASFVYLTGSGEALSPKTDPDKLVACASRVEVFLHRVNLFNGEIEPNTSSATFRLNPKAESC